VQASGAPEPSDRPIRQESRSPSEVPTSEADSGSVGRRQHTRSRLQRCPRPGGTGRSRSRAARIGRDGHKVVEGGRGLQGDDVQVNRVRTAQTVAQRSVVTQRCAELASVIVHDELGRPSLLQPRRRTAPLPERIGDDLQERLDRVWVPRCAGFGCLSHRSPSTCASGSPAYRSTESYRRR
jgi:hypothetical protein